MYDKLFITELLKILNHIIKKLVELDVMAYLQDVMCSTIRLILFLIEILCFLALLMTHTVHIKKKWLKSLNNIWRLGGVDGNFYYLISKIIHCQQLMVLKVKRIAVIIVHISMTFKKYNLYAFQFVV